MRRRRVLVGLLGVLAVLLAAGYVMLYTGAGLQLAWQVATRQLEGLSARSVSGSLLGPVVVEGLAYRAGESRYGAARVELRWRPRALLDGTVHVEELLLESPRVRLGPGGGGDAGGVPSLPAIDPPVDVRLDRFRASSLQVSRAGGDGAPEQPAPVAFDTVEADDVRLVGGRISIARLDADGTPGTLHASGTVDTRNAYSGRVEVSADVAAEGESLTLNAQLEGDTRSLDATVHLERPLAARLEGHFADLLSEPRFDATLQLAPVRAERLGLGVLGAETEATVQASGTPASMTVDGRVRFDTRHWRLGPAGVSWRDGRLEIDALALTREDRDGKLVLTATAALPPGPGGPRWQASLRADALSASWIRDDWDGTVISADLEAEGDGGQLLASGDLVVAGHELDVGHLDVARDGERISVRELALRVPALGGALSLAGSLDPAAAPVAWRASGHWDELSVPLEGEPLRLHNGEVQVDGNGTSWDVAGHTGVAGPVPAGEWTLSGRGDTRSLRIGSLAGRTLDGKATLSGTVGWAGGITWDVGLDGEALNPGKWREDWPGRLAVQGRSRGAFDGGLRDVEVEIERVAGTLREREVNANATLSSADGSDWHGEVAVRSGNSRVRGRGTWGPRIEIDASAHIPALSDFLPGAGGSLDGELSVEGPRETPEVKGELVVQELVHEVVRARRLRLSVEGSPVPQTPAHLVLAGEGIQAAGIEITSLEALASGTPEDHDAEIELQGPSGVLTAQLQGAWNETGWRGRIASLEADPTDFAPWTLDQPAGLVLRRERQQLERMCLTSRQDAGLCVEASHEAGAGGSAAWELRRLPLGTATRLAVRQLGVPVSIEGELSGTGSVQAATDGTVRGELELSSARGGLTLTDREPALSFSYESFSASASLDANGVDASASMKIDPEGSVEARLSLDGQPGRFSNVDAQVNARIVALSWLELVIPGAVSTAGRVEASLSLSGEPGSLVPAGSLRAENLRAAIPALGIEIGEGRLELDAQDARRVAVEAGVRSGPGRLEASGWLERGQDGWTATLEAKGERFEIANTAAVQGLVSPQLELTLGTERIRVEGTVDVPSARIRGTAGTRAVSASPDVVVVDEPAPQQSRRGPQLHADILVRVGEDVKLDAHGLTGELGGELRIRDVPDSVPTGNGELRLTGAYKAYGQKLDITDGRLVFTGTPVANPGLDVRATRKVDNVTVGLRISGTASDPQAEIFSRPDMEEIEALSYLVLGRPLQGAGAEEGSRLAAAVGALNLVGGKQLAMRIASRFGIDTIEVTGGDGLEESALLLGKYLSPRLYVGYGVGLLDARNVVRVRYMLSDLWTVVAESGTESRAVLRYSVEQ